MPHYTVKVVESREFLVTYGVTAENVEDLCSEEFAYATRVPARYWEKTQLDDSDEQLFIDSIEDEQGNRLTVPEEHSENFRTVRKLAEDRDNELAKKLLLEIANEWPKDIEEYETKGFELINFVAAWMPKVRELVDRTGE